MSNGRAQMVFAYTLNKANASIQFHCSWCPTMPCPVTPLLVPGFDPVQWNHMQELRVSKSDPNVQPPLGPFIIFVSTSLDNALHICLEGPRRAM